MKLIDLDADKDYILDGKYAVMAKDKCPKKIVAKICLKESELRALVDKAVAEYYGEEQDHEQTAEEEKGKTISQKPKEQKPKKTGGRRKKFDMGKLGALTDGGWSVKDIADELGCSEQTVRKIRLLREIQRRVKEEKKILDARDAQGDWLEKKNEGKEGRP